MGRMSMSFAISGPLDRLLSSQTGPQSHAATPAASAAPQRDAHALDASGSQTSRSDLGATLGRLAVERSDDTGAANAAPPIKPDLYALNRVLNHYAAQSAAVDRIISLVRS